MMGKNKSTVQQQQPGRNSGASHPFQRGMIWLLIFISPAAAYAGALIVIDWNTKNTVYLLPAELMRSVYCGALNITLRNFYATSLVAGLLLLMMFLFVMAVFLIVSVLRRIR